MCVEICFCVDILYTECVPEISEIFVLISDIYWMCLSKFVFFMIYFLYLLLIISKPQVMAAVEVLPYSGGPQLILKSVSSI